MQGHQLQVKKVYRKLGVQYINNIKDLEPVELKDFIKLMPKNGLVLDPGCAAGRDSAKLIKAGLNAVGVDLVEEFIKRAKKDVPKGKFYVMDLLDMKFPENHFDGIWACAVLLHIEKKDILKVLKAFFKILKKGGVLNIRVKRGRDTKILVDKLSQNTSRSFTLFFKYELEKYVKKAGFTIVRSKIFPDEANRVDVKWISISARK